MAKKKASFNVVQTVPQKENQRKSIVDTIGTTWGTFGAGIILIGGGYSGGKWQESIQRETQILEITNKHSKEINEQTQIVAELKARVRELKFKRTVDSVKIENHDKNK